MANVDLHTHTDKSDGKLSPDALMDCAKEKNLVAIAITDHDSVSGIEEAISVGKRLGIEVIPGIEISTSYRYNGEEYEIHLVGLFIDYKSQDIVNMCRAAKKSREGKFVRLVNKLNSVIPELRYSPINPDDIISKNHSMARPHIAEELVNRGICASYDDAFSRYLNRYDQKRELIGFKEAVDIIHKVHGLAILSHPTILGSLGNITDDRAMQEQIMADMGSVGLDGIEVRYWEHTVEREQWLNCIAQKYNLLISGGSDFHRVKKHDGPVDEDLGYLHIPKEWLDRMKQGLVDKKC